MGIEILNENLGSRGSWGGGDCKSNSEGECWGEGCGKWQGEQGMGVL